MRDEQDLKQATPNVFCFGCVGEKKAETSEFETFYWAFLLFWRREHNIETQYVAGDRCFGWIIADDEMAGRCV